MNSHEWRERKMKAENIYNYLEELAPAALKMSFDNVGFLVGDKATEVNRCLIALDITQNVISEAAQIGAQLIVSHHPIIFEPMKNVLYSDPNGKKLIMLIKNDIAAICMHTNLDIAEGGVNDALMNTLGCKPTAPLDEDGCGRIGEYEDSIAFSDFLGICKAALKTNGLRYHDADKPVKRLAVMGGSGGSAIDTVKALGCDTYVTADVKYDQFLRAKELGLNIIDGDHYCTENVVVPVLFNKLTAKFPEVEFIISKSHEQTAKFFV